MKVLRAIGKGDMNIAISHDMQTMNYLEEDRRRIVESQAFDNIYSGFNTIDELSYVQFFNELVLENKKKKPKIQLGEDHLPDLIQTSPLNQLEEIKVNCKFRKLFTNQ